MNRDISRRQFIQSALAGLGAVAAGRLLQVPANAAGRIAAGAIRWDAWYSRTDNSVYAQNSLSSAEYLHRAPSHCNVTPDVQVAAPALYPLGAKHLRWYFDNSLANVREAFDHFRDLAVEHGLDVPYLDAVVLDTDTPLWS